MMAAAVPVSHNSGSPNEDQHSTAPVLDFVCLFTRDLRRKQKRWQDGRLKYHTFNKRIMVYDDRGNFVGDAHWREDGDLDEGEELELERGGAMIQVAECTGSRDQDLSELVDKRAKEKAERQSAALARRHPMIEAASSHTTIPHFQLRHKPLHSLIGTPTGHHGRALLPTESPYEERQKLAASSEKDDTRPTKRRRREVSPPSKGGYAQSLFGASLSLSATPTSTPLVRTKTPKMPPIFVDSQSLVLPEPKGRDDNLDSASTSTRTITTDALGDAWGKAPRTVLNLQSRAPLHSADEAQTVSSPISVGTRRSEQRRSLAEKRQLGSKRVGEIGGRIEQNDSLRPISLNIGPKGPEMTIPTPSHFGGKSSSHGDLSSATASRSGDVENISADPRSEVSARTQGKGLEPRPRRKAKALQNSEGRQGLPQEQPIPEPRTELRIRPRKKRGLLMVSEKLDAENSPISKTKNPIDCQGLSTLTVDLTTDDPTNGVIGGDKSTDIGVIETIDRPRRKKRNDTESIRDIIMQDDTDQGTEPHRKRSSPDDGTISGELPRSSRSRRQPSRKKKTIPTEDSPQSAVEKSDNQGISDDGDGSILRDGVPAPRLAQLGRKSIRSKEIIGYIFDEEMDYSDELPQNKSRDEYGKRSIASGFTANYSEPQPTTPEANPTVTVPANDQLHSGQEIGVTSNDTAINFMESRNIATSHTETLPHLSRGRTESASVISGIPEVQQPAKMVVNPATRGRKAAKPSDAAGQVPQYPLPADTILGRALDNGRQGENRRKPGSEVRAEKGTDAAMPGFARANGGPWSREAHDLFEFTRPP
ncbi:hypothetical protein F5Y04DRAFT_232102 [Hypomontagnella monticulosa]|nr:hypothetical protein F5Y04DRAFT_232102 [Hypomontagnella monticulosa]